MKEILIESMVRRESWNYGVNLYMRKVDKYGSEIFAKKVEFMEDGDKRYTEPMLNLNIQEAQLLMDELWRCGLRPTEGTGSAGSLRATEKHLADMRKIVMKKLNIEDK